MGGDWMAQNPYNLALRFLLEVLALVAVGYWGWSTSSGWLRYVLALVVPLVISILWATFRVPAESPGGKAPVAVPGWARLLLEAAVFAFATWGLADAGAPLAGVIFAGVVIIHYLLSFNRVINLLRR
jgi:hypothetical protein